VLCLGENEGALDDNLSVVGETFSGPVGLKVVSGHGGGNVGLELVSVRGHIAVAGLADVGIGLVRLLNHGAKEAGELGKLAEQDSFAEVDVTEEAVEKVSQGLLTSLKYSVLYQ